MQPENFEHFTRPAAVISPVSRENGQLQWPSEVRKLARLIPNYPPVLITHELTISMPTELLYLIEELNNIQVETQVEMASNHTELVVRTFPYALWICHQYRRTPKSPSNSFLFRDFLQRIVSIYMLDCHAQECVGYAMPRGPTAKMNFFPGLSPTSSQAPFMVLYDVCSFIDSLNSILDLEPKEEQLQTVSEGLQPDFHENGFNSDSDLGSSIETGQNHHDNTNPELVPPLDSHRSLLNCAQEVYLLIDQQSGEAPGVAVLCAGSLGDLEPLMMSALYQRLAWGVREPLVGFAWDPDSVFINVIFGWVEQQRNEDRCLPNVRLAYAEEKQTNGCFDMRNPASVLQLLLFIASIQDVFTETAQLLEASVPHVVESIRDGQVLQWRADSVPEPMNEACLMRDELLSRWMRDSDYGNRCTDILQTEDSASGIIHDVMSFVDNESSFQKSRWERSRSYFVGEKTWRENPVDLMWLQDRRAFAIYLSGEDVFPSKEFYQIYVSYTKLYNPPSQEWADPETFKSFGIDLSDFMIGLAELIDTDTNEETLGNDIWEHVHNALGIIALQSVSSRGKMEYRKSHPSLRSDCRTEWDNLTHFLLHGTSEGNYNLRTECDRSINLPRNMAADALLRVVNRDICFEYILHFSRRLRATAKLERMVEAEMRHSAAINRVSYYEDHSIHGRQLCTAMRLDPTEARVDCLGILAAYPREELATDNHRDQDTHQAKRSSFSRSSGVLCPTKDRSSPAQSSNAELPIFYQEHTKSQAYAWEIPSTSLNRLKMDLVAGVTHLTSLGITEFPLFGVATEGSIGSILCAWCGPMKLLDGEIQSCIYVVDKDVVQYDLSTPLGAYNYSTFLSMLVKRHIPELIARLEKVEESGPEYAKKDWKEIDWIRDDWTMGEQIGVFQDSVVEFSRQ